MTLTAHDVLSFPRLQADLEVVDVDGFEETIEIYFEGGWMLEKTPEGFTVGRRPPALFMHSLVTSPTTRPISPATFWSIVKARRTEIIARLEKDIAGHAKYSAMPSAYDPSSQYEAYLTDQRTTDLQAVIEEIRGGCAS